MTGQVKISVTLEPNPTWEIEYQDGRTLTLSHAEAKELLIGLSSFSALRDGSIAQAVRDAVSERIEEAVALLRGQVVR